ncbi:MAG: hypothetical protein PHO01_02165 [Desulfotomaculaceae bacterium]|nr:hypothetical protein [Desulfotomaculaceae bacterium]
MSALSWIKEMLVFNRPKDITIQRLLAVLVLAGAIYAAYNASGILTWLGVAYYIFCIAALLLFKHPRVRLLLWFAVFAHTLLVGYSLWEWKTEQVIPCLYCFSAAFLALIAAILLYRLPVAIVPVIFFAGMLYAWPYAFAVGPGNLVEPAASNIEESLSTVENTAINPSGESAEAKQAPGQVSASATNTSNTVPSLPKASSPKETSAPVKEPLPDDGKSSETKTSPEGSATEEGNATEVSGQKPGNASGDVNNSSNNVEPAADPETETNPANDPSTTQPKPKSG